MAIEIPPWEQVSPTDAAASGARGFGLGLEALSRGAQIQQAQQELKQRQQQLDVEKQRYNVAGQIAQQRQALMTQQAAAQSKAMLDYQNAIKGGMDPAQAAMMFGPAMSGGRMTGYSPIFTGWEKANAPQPQPTEPQPVKDGNGNVIGYADKSGNVKYIPQPKPDPSRYEDITDVDPGTPATPGLPAIPASSIWPFNHAAVPAVPGIPGTPKVTTHRKVYVPYGPVNQPTVATSGAATSPANSDDPLGLFTQ